MRLLMMFAIVGTVFSQDGDQTEAPPVVGDLADKCNGRFRCPPIIPPIETDETGDRDYEIRTYSSANWTWIGTEYEQGVSFRKLFNYINANGIQMTIPVPKKIRSDGNSTMYFYIPSVTDNVPRTNDPSIETTQPQLPRAFFVRKFGGKATITDYRNNVDALMEDVAGDSTELNPLNYNEDAWFKVGYDAPWAPVNGRLNEVWLEKLD